MFEAVPYIRKGNEATPDRLVIPEWGYSIQFYSCEGVVFTYIENALYVGMTPVVHPIMYSKYKFKEHGFDGRIWIQQKVLTFWFDCSKTKKEFCNDIMTVRQKFLDRVFVSFSEKEPFLLDIDISDYTFIFIGVIDGKNMIIRCDYDSFFSEDFELFNTYTLRFFRPFRRVKKEELKPGDKTEYQRYCEWWVNKIGSMDVAEWHLLMYEE